MIIDDFKRLLNAEPFIPFFIHLADGRRIAVRHPDLASSSSTGRVVHVFHGPTDSSIFIDTGRVKALELETRAASPA